MPIVPAELALVLLGILHFLIITTPGLDYLATAKVSYLRGQRAGYQTAAGIMTGHLILTLFGMVLIGALGPRSSLGQAVSVIGVLFVIYYVTTVQMAIVRRRVGLKPSFGKSIQPVGSSFVIGVKQVLSNINASLYYICFIPIFISPERPVLSNVAFFIVMLSISFLWFSFVAFILGSVFVRSDPNLFSILRMHAYSEGIPIPLGLSSGLKKCLSHIEEGTLLRHRAELGNALSQCLHDIRSPVAALKMLPIEESGMDKDHQLLLSSAIQRIGSIAESLLGKRRGIIRNEGDTVQLSELIQVVMNEKRLEFSDRKELDLKVSIASGLEHLNLKLDPMNFMRIISNLLSNAVEAISGSGKVEISARLTEGFIEIQISDNGCGIPSAVLERLGKFEVTSGKAHGNGLGVLHAHACVKEWGGTIQFDPETNGGTRVTVQLPNSVILQT